MHLDERGHPDATSDLTQNKHRARESPNSGACEPRWNWLLLRLLARAIRCTRRIAAWIRDAQHLESEAVVAVGGEEASWAGRPRPLSAMIVPRLP